MSRARRRDLAAGLVPLDVLVPVATRAALDGLKRPGDTIADVICRLVEGARSPGPPERAGAG